MLAVQLDPAVFGPCFPMFDATWMCWNIIAVKNFAAVFLLGRISMGHSHDGGPGSQYTIIPICISHVTLLPWSHVMTRNMPWRAPRWDLLGYSSSTWLPHWQWATMPCQCAAGKIEGGFDLRDKWINIIRGNRVFYPKMQRSIVFVSPELLQPLQRNGGSVDVFSVFSTCIGGCLWEIESTKVGFHFRLLRIVYKLGQVQ